MKRLNSTTYTFQNKRGTGRSTHLVEVGDRQDAALFFPQAKIKFWNNEVNFSMRLVNFGKGTHTFRPNGQVVWVGDGVRCTFLEKDDGEFNFVTILTKRPTSNRLRYSIRYKGLSFFKQPDLRGQVSGNISEGPINQPANVVDSYAVYHSSKRDRKYETGKAFHIYRVRLRDADGNKAWGDQVIDAVSNRWIKILPRAFLNTATYPVRVS